MSEAEQIGGGDDGEAKTIGRIGDYVIWEDKELLVHQLSKEETEMYAEALAALARALKKRGKTLWDLL